MAKYDIFSPRAIIERTNLSFLDRRSHLKNVFYKSFWKINSKQFALHKCRYRLKKRIGKDGHIDPLPTDRLDFDVPINRFKHYIWWNFQTFARNNLGLGLQFVPFPQIIGKSLDKPSPLQIWIWRAYSHSTSISKQS